MELQKFCADMQLGIEAEAMLKPNWEKILQNRPAGLPEFVSEEYICKYLPALKLSAEVEQDILARARQVIDMCRKNDACAMWMQVIHHAALLLKQQVSPALKSSVWGENEGIAALFAALSSAPLIEENCRKRGIPLHYAADALQWIGGTVDIYQKSHNQIPGHTLGQLYVLHHHIDGELYRIGRFEYMLHRLPEWAPLVFRNNDGVLAVFAAPGLKFNADGLVTLQDEVIESFIEEDGDFVSGIPCSPDGIARINEKLTIDRREFKPVCAPWDLVPSIHIPGGLRMSWDDALASMKEAREFFKRYLKREISMFVCGSWILNPALEKFAPNGNMTKFRRQLYCAPMIRWGNEGRDGMFFAFGRSDVPPTEITPANSIQQILQEIYRAEGTLRTGSMFVLTEDLDRLGDMYYRTKVKFL